MGEYENTCDDAIPQQLRTTSSHTWRNLSTWEPPTPQLILQGTSRPSTCSCDRLITATLNEFGGSLLGLPNAVALLHCSHGVEPQPLPGGLARDARRAAARAHPGLCGYFQSAIVAGVDFEDVPVTLKVFRNQVRCPRCSCCTWSQSLMGVDNACLWFSRAVLRVRESKCMREKQQQCMHHVQFVSYNVLCHGGACARVAC